MEPDTSLENQLSSNYPLVAYIDECGRGAVGGGAYVGVVIIDKLCLLKPHPPVRDSKQIAANKREGLVGDIKSWVKDFGVGSATASEVDGIGINKALRLAAYRAYDLKSVDYIVLDGSHNWLGEEFDTPPVLTVVKGDTTSVGLACASIIAKVKHDADIVKLMEESPEYMWSSHKGYPTKEHKEKIAQYGYSVYHRKTWKLS